MLKKAKQKRTHTNKGKQITRFVAGNHTFWFGKYKGRKVKDIVNNDPAYIDWCMRTLHGLRFNNAIKEKIKNWKIDQRNSRWDMGYEGADIMEQEVWGVLYHDLHY